MKLRIRKDGDEFVPEYLDESKTKPIWRECRTDDYLDCRYYFTQEEAMEVIDEFKKQHPKPEVVWEEEY